MVPPPDMSSEFDEYRRSRDVRLRNRLVEAHLSLAEFHSRRFATGSTSREDVAQVAKLAVIAAVERFDPAVGTSFRTFAARTIEGECKRYLRDRSWTIRPPRSVQELSLRLRRAQEEMSHSLRRPPTVAEIASYLDVTEEQVLEAMEASMARSGVTLDEPTEIDGGSEPRRSLSEVIGQVEVGYARVDDRALARALLSELGGRERQILDLRFGKRWTESQIAAELGVSQSYLSRLLRRILDDLRRKLQEPPGDTVGDRVGAVSA